MRSILLLFIIALALLVRLPGILQGNFAFTYDSGRDLLAIRDLVTRADFSLIGPTTGLMGVFYGPWWYWFLVPPFVVFGGSPIGMTSWIAIMGAVAAALAFWWGTKKFGIVFGSVLGILLAASPVVVTMTSQLWNPDVLILLTVGVVILLSDIRLLTTIRLILFGFLLALLIEFEIVYGILFIMGFGLSVFLWLRRHVQVRKIASIGLGMLIAESPRILFELRNNFIQTRSLFSGVGDGQNLWQLYTKRDWLLYGSLSSVLPGTPLLQNILIIGVLFILFSFWTRVSTLNKRFILTILTIIAIFWLSILVYPRDFWPYYLFGLPVLYSVLIALVFSFLWRVSPRFTLVLLTFYLFALLKPVDMLRSIMNPHFVGDAAVFHNQEEVVRTLFKEAKSDFKYIAYTPPQIDHTWKYLFWWKNLSKKTYGLSENPPIMYVIIEPDPNYPERLKEWFKVREKDGVVVSEKRFSSGIVVQTRRLRWE